MKIIPYKDEYRLQLLSIWEESVSNTHSFLSAEDFDLIKQAVFKIDFKLLHVFFASENDQLIAFIGVYNKKVEMLFVLPEYIRKGIGKQLMNFVITEYNVNETDVNEQNENAVSFYQSLGFKTYERTENDDQGKGYPLLRMKLDQLRQNI